MLYIGGVKMEYFDRSFVNVIHFEKGYSNNPLDSGGATNLGITEAVARENGYSGDMEHLPMETAKQIYKNKYWNTLNLDSVASKDFDIADRLFNIGVNMGCTVAGKFLQRAINLFRTEQLELDGDIGQKTIHALGLLGMQELIMIFNLIKWQQAYRYMEICEHNPSQKVFIKGWIRRVL
jgi:lysozyme family protein